MDGEDPVGVPESRAVASDTSSEGGSICSEEGSVSSENSEYTPSDYNAALQSECIFESDSSVCQG